MIAPGNIWTGSRMLAWLTAPTELAFRKSNMKAHYPIVYLSNQYADVEAAYQYHKRSSIYASIEKRYELMTELLVIRFIAYPKMLDLLLDLGGIEYLEKCEHRVYGKAVNWEGTGRGSGYVRCLINAVERLAAFNLSKCVARTKKGKGTRCRNNTKGQFHFCGPHLDYLSRHGQIGMIDGLNGNVLHAPIYTDMREERRVRIQTEHDAACAIA